MARTTTTLEDFRELIQLPKETRCIEFKAAENTYGMEKILKYVSALGNEGDARFVLGVTDQPPRRVVGTKAFPNVGDIDERVHEILKIRVDAQELVVDGQRVIIVHIPGRGVGRLYRYNHIAWMRTGERLVEMNDDRQREILLEGRGHYLDQTLDGIAARDLEALLDLQAFFRLSGIQLPSHADALRDALVDRQLLLRDGKNWAIPRVTALLFAHQLVDVDLQQFAPRVVKFKGIDRRSSVSDKIGAHGYALAFPNLVRRIRGLAPDEEVIGAAFRERVVHYPEHTLRELVANALLHQDFERGERPRIEIFEDRIEIWNDGEPQIQPDRFINNRRPRNRMLTDIAREIRICEAFGSGVARALRAIEEHHLPPPDFRSEKNDMQVLLSAYAPFADQTGPTHVRACYQHACLRYGADQRLTNESLRERFGLEKNKKNTAAVSRIISAALAQNRIVKDDETSKKLASYKPYFARPIDRI